MLVKKLHWTVLYRHYQIQYTTGLLQTTAQLVHTPTIIVLWPLLSTVLTVENISVWLKIDTGIPLWCLISLLIVCTYMFTVLQMNAYLIFQSLISLMFLLTESAISLNYESFKGYVAKSFHRFFMIPADFTKASPCEPFIVYNTFFSYS